MRAYAASIASLLELPPGDDLCDAGEAPDLHEVLAEVRGGPRTARKPPPGASNRPVVSRLLALEPRLPFVKRRGEKKHSELRPQTARFQTRVVGSSAFRLATEFS